MIGNRTLTLVLTLATATMAAGVLRAGESASSDAPGAVYALTNSPAGNAVLVYHRDADGALAPAGAYATDGAGNGAGLGSQGAVVVSDDGRLLFAVNAGSNSISSFQIRPDGLELASTTSSGGTTPVSVASRGGLLYALNAGVPNSVSGFSVGRHGELKPFAGSTQPLSAPDTNPAQVGFSDDGDALIMTGQRAACWAVATKNGRYGYVINAGTGNISGFAIARDGSVTLLNASGVTATTGGNPTDAALSRDSRFLYVRVAALREIAIFRVASDGSLEALPSLTGSPDGLAGLAAF